MTSIAPTAQNPATARLGARLTPTRLDYVPEALLFGLYLIALSRGPLWLTLSVSAAAVVLIIASAAARRRRRGAVAHERYRLQDALGWGIAGLMAALLVLMFLTNILLDELRLPLWAALPLSAALAAALYGSLQRWTRARARLIASPEGAQQHERALGPSPATGGVLEDAEDLNLCDLLNRTQLMRPEALAHDLGRPETEIRGRVEALTRRGLVKSQQRWRAPHEPTGWVHLTFRGEQELAVRPVV